MIFPRHNEKNILLVFVFLFFPIKSNFAQVENIYDENTLINSFLESLYNFSFHEADSMIVILSNTNIDKSTISNIKANLAWWKLLSGDAIDQNLRNCHYNIDESIKLLLKSNRQDSDALLNIIYSYSLKARLENYSGNTLTSLIYFYKSIGYIQKFTDRPIENEKLYLVLGLYFYFVDYIENEYPVMSAIFFSLPDGDKTRGLKYLEDCSSSENEMIRTEANYFLLKIYAYIEKDYSRAYQNAQFLTQQYSKNLVYNLEKLKLLLVLEKSSEAQIFQKKLIGEIQTAENINNMQKNHFISQIQELTKTGY